MGFHKGKFYDAKKTRMFCDEMKKAVKEYGDYALAVHTAYDDFDENVEFNGKTATALKKLVLHGTGNVLTELTDIHAQMVDDQTYLITSFESMVDSAQNARIEYDTLDVIDRDFKHSLKKDKKYYENLV